MKNCFFQDFLLLGQNGATIQKRFLVGRHQNIGKICAKKSELGRDHATDWHQSRSIGKCSIHVGQDRIVVEFGTHIRYS